MQVPELQIVPMTELDLNEVLKIDSEIFPFDGWSAQAFRSSILAGDSWIIKLGSEILGYAIFTHVVGESELLHIGIHPNHRQEGLASLLMSFMLERTLRIGTFNWFLVV